MDTIIIRKAKDNTKKTRTRMKQPFENNTRTKERFNLMDDVDSDYWYEFQKYIDTKPVG